MNRYIKQKVGLFLMIQFSICVLVLISSNIKWNIVLSVIHLILGLFVLKLDKGLWISFVAIFNILSYILHMGNLLAVRVFGYDNTYLNSFEDTVINQSIFFVMMCHTALIMGAVIKKWKTWKIKTPIKLEISEKRLEQLGWICLAIGILPRLFIDINLILLQINGGYLKSLSQVTHFGWKSVLAQFFYIGVVILLFLSKHQRLRARIILIIVTIWEVITMLSGGRIYAVSFIVVLIYIYCVRIETPRLSAGLFLGVAGYCLLLLLNIAAQIRMEGGFRALELYTAAKLSFGEENQVLKILCEMGGTIATVFYSLINFPSYSSFAFGASYIETILAIFPYFENNFVNINHLIYIYNFQYNSYLGGSWIGEVFYNFSYCGFLYAYILGRTFGQFEKIFEQNEKCNNYAVSLIVLTFLFYTITYIRDYFARFGTAIQVCAVLLVISYFLSNIKWSIGDR